MRCDPIELDLTTDARARQVRSEVLRKTGLPADRPCEQAALAPQLLDEAFALFESDQAYAGCTDDPRAVSDVPAAVCESLSGPPTSDKLSYSRLSTAQERIEQQRKLVDNLSAQLTALDRQREHLARLLQDIDAECYGSERDLARK
jgi:hypothetical protein